MNLIEAVEKNDQEAVSKLLSQGCDPNEAEDEANITPLHFAVQNNDLEIAFLLMSAGADPLAQEDSGGDTPLDLAKLLKHTKMFGLLNWFIDHQENISPVFS